MIIFGEVFDMFDGPSKAEGFTLIELLVVIAIIGILAAAALPQVMGAICDARISRLQGNIRTAQTAINQAIAQDGLGFEEIADDCGNLGDNCEALEDYLPAGLIGEDGDLRVRDIGDGRMIDHRMPDGCPHQFEGMDEECSGDELARFNLDAGGYTDCMGS